MNRIATIAGRSDLHAVLYVVTGRHRELGPTLWILALISVGLLGLESR